MADVKAIKEANGNFTLWAGSLTIIDHRTGRPIELSPMAVAGINKGMNTEATRIAKELTVDRQRYQRV